MAYWIFKVAEQELYPDIPGEKYVFDNTHSIRIASGDVFLYLDKRKKYSFTATGMVRLVEKRSPTAREAGRTPKVRQVITAHLDNVLWFKEPLTISPGSKDGRANRSRLGILDVNLLGWSQSIPSLNEEMYKKILDLADLENLLAPGHKNSDFSIPDNWAKTKVRAALKRFSDPVLARSNSTCIVCGTSLAGLTEAAHLSPYASDKSNRANPGNGICLCRFCHRSLDLRLIAIESDGSLLVSPTVKDKIALHHFSQISSQKRLQWLRNVDVKFLVLTVQWFNENLSNTESRR
jgi:hypothetical protein